MNKNKYTVQNNRMFYEGKILFTVKDPIQHYILIAEGLVVLLDSSKSKDSENVYCYNFNGELRWQIEPIDKIHSDNYYTSLYFSEDNLLQAYNINGIEVTLNKEDGSTFKKELIK